MELDFKPKFVSFDMSPKYDLRPAADLGIPHKVYMDRGYEPDQPWVGYTRITDVAGLPDLLGLPRPQPARWRPHPQPPVEMTPLPNHPALGPSSASPGAA